MDAEAIRASPIPDITLEADLLQKFNESGPYYTNYPTHGNWSAQLGHGSFAHSLANFLSKHGEAPLHLYVHIPFCAKLCYFCICNIKITNDRQKMQRFVDYLCREIDLLHHAFSENSIRPNIKEIHLGGGTPSHLANDQFEQVINKLRDFADLGDLCEFAMEIDPRTTNKENLKLYRTLGINRFSFGIQDFDPEVQKAINRVQPVEMVEDLLSIDETGPVNFDLLYGLPRQSRKTFEKTVDLVKKLSPDRITLLKYAHAPELRKHMRLIDANAMPLAGEQPLMFIDAVQSLTADGYVWIGIDHFAKPSDDLAVAAKEKRIWRNFGGYTTGVTRDLIGIGPSATCAIGNSYFQNAYELNDYYSALEKGQFAIHRGYQLDDDDVLRREIILSIICNDELDCERIEGEFGISFEDYFRQELAALSQFRQAGILKFSDRSFSLTPTGRFFGRHVAKVFDKFLQRTSGIYKITGP